MEFKRLYDDVLGSTTFTKAYKYATEKHMLSYDEQAALEGGEVTYRADIGSGNDVMKTYITVRSADEVEYGCTCSDFARTNIPCEHIVALSYYADKMQTKRQEDPSLIAEDPVFSVYKRMIRADVYAAENDGIRLVPVFSDTGNALSLRFKVGAKKLYTVKDFLAFLKRVKGGEYFSYGEKLAFYHVFSVFTEPGRTLLRYLVSTQDFNVADNSAYGERALKKVDGALMDMLYELYGGTLVATDRDDCDMLLSTAAPRIAIDVSARDAYALITPQNAVRVVAEGHRCIYVQENNAIYRLQGQAMTVLRPILTELTLKKKILLSETHLYEWFANVAPMIAPYCEISYSRINTDKYRPPQLKSALYIDLEGDIVTARLVCRYDGAEFDIYAAGGDFVGRSLRSELMLKAALDKYFERRDHGFYCQSHDMQYELFTMGIAEIEKYCEIFAGERFNAVKIRRSPSVGVGVRLDGELLKIKVNFAGEYTGEELMQILDAYRRRKKYVRISSGDFVDLTSAEYEHLDEMLEFSGANDRDMLSGELTAPKYRTMHLDRLLSESGMSYVRDSGFKAIIAGLKSFEAADYQLDGRLYPIMRHYQRVGYRWFSVLGHFGFGGILADDMGLGKSLQTIAYILGIRGDAPSLIVCPSSLILNWVSEFKKFAPELNILPVYGVKKSRNEKLEHMAQVDVVITSYELLRQDIETYESMRFNLAVIDEGQYIKNHTTKNAKAVKAIKADRRFALTGTPIENNIAELWSIFDFIMPGYLYSYGKFKELLETKIVRDDDREAAARLHRMVSPFILRRLKSDVLSELPPKIDNLISLPLIGEQKDLYAATLASVIGEIRAVEDYDKNRIAVLSYLMRLRQICCSPDLLYDDYHGNNEKLQACIDLIETGISGGHKILLFSQFTSMLAVIKQELKKRGIKYYLLQGDTKKEERMRLVDAFNADDTPVFLLSLKAGGTGLNLTGADIVIHYDPWWNLSVQNQATDRAHRIGQDKSVRVYRLIMKDTIEERIVELQEKKRELFDTIIKGGGTDISSMSKAEILQLLSE